MTAEQAPEEAGPAQAEWQVLSLGMRDPRLWPEIFARGVTGRACREPLVRRLLDYVRRSVDEIGSLPGASELLGQAASRTERERLKWCVQLSPDTAALPVWCDRVVQAAQRRALARVGADLQAAAARSRAEPAQLAASAVTELVEAVRPSAAVLADGAESWTAIALEDLAETRQRGVSGIPTGVEALDRLTLLRPGDLALLAAETGTGKTGLALAITRAAAAAGKFVLYLNTEMDDREIQLRLLAAESGVPATRLQVGRITDEEQAAVTEAAARLARANRIWLSRLEAMLRLDVLQLSVAVRAHRAMHGLDLSVLDYIGRLELEPGRGREEKEYRLLERAVAEIKRLAQSLGVAALVLVQRTFDGHLAGSKAMRNEADVVLELEPVKAGERSPGPDATHRLRLTKNRHGQTATVGLVFDADRMRFREVGCHIG